MTETNNTSNTQKVVKGISSQTLVVLVLGVVEIVTFSIMSRLLTKEDFGYYAAITAITTIFATFSDAGIGSALIQRKDMNDNFKNNAFSLSFIFGSALSLLLLILSVPLADLVLDRSMAVPLMLMSVTLLCNSMVSVNYSLMQRKLQFLRVGVINLVSLIITATIAILLAMNGYGFYAIITKAVLYSVLTLVISYFFVNEKFRWVLDKETVKSIWGFGGWLTFSVVVRNIGSQTDRLIMGRLLSVEILGCYNRPKEFIGQISNRIDGIFDTALFPVLSGIQDNRNSLASAYRTSIYYMNILSMLLSMSFICNRELIIRIFFGEEWMSVSIIFIILAINLIFNTDARLSDCYYRSLGLTKQQFYFRCIEMVLTISLVVLGALLYGVIGVAVGYTIANFTMIFAKVKYLASYISVPFSEVISTLLSSWHYALFIYPVMILLSCFTPDNIYGNIIELVVFTVMCVLAFLVFPQIIGSRYKNEAYIKLRKIIKK